MKRPESEWLINRDFANCRDEIISQTELLKCFRDIIHNTQQELTSGIHRLLDSHCTNDWEYLLFKTQVLIFSFQKTKYSSINDQSTIDAAKHLWFLSEMPATIDAMKEGKLRELDIREVEGLKVVCGRAATGLQKFFGKNYLPVIMGNTRVAYLVMLHAHCKDHAGRDVTMAMACLDA